MKAIALAVSGGADSVFLATRVARLWQRGMPRPIVLSVDHGERGEAGAADAAFVATLAAELSLPFRALRADPSRVRKHGRASEARLRAERYALLERAAREAGAGSIWLAHQRDDQVETIVLAALRGAGLNGLSGMRRRRALSRSRRDLALVRPLLGIERSTIEAALALDRRPHRVDETNADLRFLRNRVRHLTLPALRQAFGAGLDLRLLRLGRVARVLWRRALTSRGQLDTDALHARIELAALRHVSPQASRVVQRAILERAAGRFDAGGGVVLAVSDGAVTRLRATPPAGASNAAPATSRVVLKTFERKGAAPRLLRAFSSLGAVRLRGHVARRGVLHLDADRISAPLVLRTRLAGDRFQPLGLSAEAKLKDLLIARKVPREARDRLAVLCDARGIVAVEGLPPAARVVIGASTRRVLRVRVVAAAPWLRPPAAVRGRGLWPQA